MSKGLQQVKEILGEYNLWTATAPDNPRTSHHPPKPFDLNGPQKSPPEYLRHRAQPPPTTTFEFDGMIWMKMHVALMPPTDEQHNPEDRMNATTPPTTWWKTMPRDAYSYASGNAPTNSKSTTKWHQKFPALGQLPSALMTKSPQPSSKQQSQPQGSHHP